jgi:pantoate kinase
VLTNVNGDQAYDARTTRRSVELLLERKSPRPGGISLSQLVQTPIGSGFGASAAAAVSAVYAVAAASNIKGTKSELALFAHKAEIVEATGLGTVSVIYDSVGAGAITIPGEPGAAKFITVEVPKETRIVTGYFAPFDKKDALSSKRISERINRLGHESLTNFLADPSFDTLAGEGERFSRNLGLESPEVKKMIKAAKSSGAWYASQNMIGYSVHALVDSDLSGHVASALRGLSKKIRIDTFEVGNRKAGLVRANRW